MNARAGFAGTGAARAWSALAAACVAALAAAQESVRDAATAQVQPEQLRAFHDLLASEPHIAGTAGDAREIRRIELAFRGMGLEVEVAEIWPLLAVPVSARVEIVAAGEAAADAAPTRRRGVLPVIERNLAEDPAAAHPDLTWGWCAYGGSGAAEGEVVYANYGRAEDFAQLKAWGIDLAGKIVLARYGGNFRGFKERFAREAGAVGLLIYIDPADSGVVKGPAYPQGTWANDSCIQRGSLLTLDYIGDPLTPGWPATREAKRLEESAVALPSLPVQPIGYAAAGQIMAAMAGEGVGDPSWQGGMELPYKLTGGSACRVRMDVRQRREVRRTANIIARLKGSSGDGSCVIIGCHHDAWGFGAADPLAGTIVLMECAKAFAAAAASGVRPGSDLLFCAWGAEEFGIIGSTEWVEANGPLLASARAYINLDMASMGMKLGVTASASLRDGVARACSVDAATVRPPGGGSDHVAFLCHAGVPCVEISAGGAPGTAYHSNYDTTEWYRKAVGSDYASAVLVTRAAIAAAAALSDPQGLNASAGAVVSELLGACTALRTADPQAGDPLAEARSAALGKAEECLLAARAAAEAIDRSIATRRSIAGSATAEATKMTLAIDRAFLDPSGIPGRPWYRDIRTATNPVNSYQSGLLPGLRWATTAGQLDLAVAQLCTAGSRLAELARTDSHPGTGAEPAK